MTSCVRVLSTQALDSFPSLLLVSPNGTKILVNCGEGCQRVFLEFGQKVSSIDQICLSHLGHETIGGLPGMILTASDVLKMATDHAKQAAAVVESKQKQPPKQNNNNQHDSLPIQPGLKILGPNGTQTFYRSLRHFMRRDSFAIDIKEGACVCGGSNVGKKKKKKNAPNTTGDESFRVESFSAYATQTNTDETALTSPSRKRPRTSENPGPSSPRHNPQDTREILSFLFTTPPIQGRFLIEKAKALGVPRGPMYGKLKAGHSVAFEKTALDGSTESVTVESHEVVEPGSPGVVVAVLTYPSLEILEQIKNSKQMQQFHPNATCAENPKPKDDKPMLELIVHMAPRSVFDCESCAVWRKSSFDTSVQHMFVPAEKTSTESMDSEAAFRTLSVFQSAHSGAHLRSKVSLDVFRSPMAKYKEDMPSQEAKGENVVHGVPLLEYVLLPRAKRGFSNHDLFLTKWKAMEEENTAMLDSSGCIEKAKQLLDGIEKAKQLLDECNSLSSSIGGEILFTGTGSAIPCKHRNVSGIYVRMKNDNAMLLDVGEGTIGQLLRAKQHQEHRGEANLSEIIAKIKAVWISHPHADHHLGILRLLAERKRLLGDKDPLVLIGPPNILRFLQDYELAVPEVAGSYLFLDCRTISTNDNTRARFPPNDAAQNRLKEDLGITNSKAIPVAHCAHSYAVIFYGTSFGSIAYSGDCRPSRNFVREAYDANILIHEATFADGMEADAVVKRHCTAGEALMVGRDMNAKTTILTHFSQRYPKLPVLQTNENKENTTATVSSSTMNSSRSSSSNSSTTMRVIHAFDFMTITPSNMDVASKLTPALQLLYPDESEDTKNNASDATSDAKAALEVPGLFARSELL